MTPPPPIRIEEILAQAGWVRGVARRLARDASSADDLTQGALTAALERPPGVDRPLRPWLARVVTHLARKERRAAARRAQRERHHARAARAVPATDQLLAELDEQRRLARLVGGLREPYRSVLLLRYYRDLSAPEIARALGSSPATVRSQLARGLALLRERVEASHGGDPRRALGALLLAAGERGPAPPPVGIAASVSKSIALQPLLVMKSSTGILAASVVCALVVTGVLALRFLDSDDPVSPEPAAAVEAQPAPPELEGAEPVAVEEHGARESLARAEEPDAPGAEPEPEPAPPEIGPTTFVARAVDATGQPLAGASFQLVDEEGVPRALGRGNESGADGRVEILLPKEAFFTYTGRDVSNTYLSLWAPGHARHFFVPGATRGTKKDLGDIALVPGGSVAGQVIDESGLPVDGAVVVGTEGWAAADVERARVAGPAREPGRPTTTSDARGRFRLDGLHPGQGLVWASARGKLWGVSDELEIVGGVTAHGVELVLEPLPAEAAIRGLVVGPDGAPLPNATVYYRIPSGWSEEEQVSTDVAGAFLVPVGAESRLKLMAIDPAGELGQSAETLAQAGDADVRLVCPERRVLRIRVVDAADGAPIEKAAVIDLPLQEQTAFMNARFKKTDADGLLELPAPGESFRISAGHTDYRYRQFGPFEPDALPEELLVELTRLPMVTGVVLDGERPVAGANIELVESCEERFRPLQYGFPQRLFDGGIQKAVSDEEGRFRVATNEHASGMPVLLVDKKGYALTELQLSPDEPSAGVDDVEVQMIAGGALEGRVLVGNKRSPESVVVIISRGDGRPKWTRPGANGNYRFEHLTPGAWRVEDRDAEPEGRVFGMAQGDEHPFRWDCEVFADRTTEHDLDLRWQDDLRVTGRLLFDGVGAVGWTAVLEAPDHADRPWPARPVTLGEDGDFALEARPGYAKLVLRSAVDAPTPMLLKRELLVDQQLQPSNFELATGGFDGTLPEGALKLRLFHRIDPTTHVEALFESDRDGRFTVTGVPAGTASFQNEVEGTYGLGWYGRDTVEVVAGAVTTVE